MYNAPDRLPICSVERPDGAVSERHINAAVFQGGRRNDVGKGTVVPPDLGAGGGVDGEHHWCRAVHTIKNDVVRDRRRCPCVVGTFNGVGRKAPQLLTSVLI